MRLRASLSVQRAAGGGKSDDRWPAITALEDGREVDRLGESMVPQRDKKGGKKAGVGEKRVFGTKMLRETGQRRWRKQMVPLSSQAIKRKQSSKKSSRKGGQRRH